MECTAHRVSSRSYQLSDDNVPALRFLYNPIIIGCISDGIWVIADQVDHIKACLPVSERLAGPVQVLRRIGCSHNVHSANHEQEVEEIMSRLCELPPGKP